jgi:hypothetical protein
MNNIIPVLVLPPCPDAQDAPDSLPWRGLLGQRPLEIGAIGVRDIGGGTPAVPLRGIAIAGVQDVAAELVLAVREEAEDAAAARPRPPGRRGLRGFGRRVRVDLLPDGRAAAFAMRPAVLLGGGARPVFAWVVVEEYFVSSVGY